MVSVQKIRRGGGGGGVAASTKRKFKMFKTKQKFFLLQDNDCFWKNLAYFQLPYGSSFGLFSRNQNDENFVHCCSISALAET